MKVRCCPFVRLHASVVSFLADGELGIKKRRPELEDRMDWTRSEIGAWGSRDKDLDRMSKLNPSRTPNSSN